MTVQLVWSVFCSSSAIDRDTNQVSLFDVIEKISGQLPDSLPEEGRVLPIPLHCQLVSLWERRTLGVPCSEETQVRLAAPSGQTVLSSKHQVDLTQFERRRLRFNLAGFPYVGNGRYRFIIEWLPSGAEPVQVGDVPVEVQVELHHVTKPDQEPGAPVGQQPAMEEDPKSG